MTLRRSSRHVSQRLQSSSPNLTDANASNEDSQTNSSDDEQSEKESDNYDPDNYHNDLPAPDSYTIQLHLRSGEPYTHRRTITSLPDPRPFQHTLEDSFGMLHEIVLARAQKNSDC